MVLGRSSLWKPHKPMSRPMAGLNRSPLWRDSSRAPRITSTWSGSRRHRFAARQARIDLGERAGFPGMPAMMQLVQGADHRRRGLLRLVVVHAPQGDIHQGAEHQDLFLMDAVRRHGCMR